MTIQAHLRRTPPSRIELSPLLPYLNRANSSRFPTIDDLNSGPIEIGRHRGTFGEWFEMQRQGEQAAVELHGDLSACDGLGGGVLPGAWTVHSSVGYRWGQSLAGGQLKINGNAADDLGNSMSGGTVVLSGSAGQRVGGPRPGADRGMTGGAIVVAGNCGEAVGWRMRRGTIAVAGDAGDGLAWQMKAGTVVVQGNCAGTIADGMSRGTLILLHQRGSELPWPFEYVAEVQTVALQMIFRWLQRLSPIAWRWPQASGVPLYRQLSVPPARGEIFVLAR